MNVCTHGEAVAKFESHYQQHPLVGNESQFRCDCDAVVKIGHQEYEPGGPKAIRLVPMATLKQAAAARPEVAVPKPKKAVATPPVVSPAPKPKATKKGKK